MYAYIDTATIHISVEVLICGCVGYPMQYCCTSAFNFVCISTVGHGDMDCETQLSQPQIEACLDTRKWALKVDVRRRLILCLRGLQKTGCDGAGEFLVCTTLATRSPGGPIVTVEAFG